MGTHNFTPYMVVVLVTLTATVLIQLGYFLWKLSADGQPKIGGAPAWQVLCALATDWRWMLGFVMTSLGWVLFVQATAMGDISLVQPLMSAGDLLLVILAVVFLKERLLLVEWGGVLMTVLGAVALAWNAEASYVTSFNSMHLQILLGCATIIGLTLLLTNRWALRPEVSLALVVGLCFGSGAVLTKAMTVAYSGPGQTIMTWAVLIDPLLLAVVLANVFGLILLQAAFQRGRAAVIVPLQLAMANAITVLAGGIIFNEQITPLRTFGIVLILGGTALLHLKPSTVSQGLA